MTRLLLVEILWRGEPRAGPSTPGHQSTFALFLGCFELCFNPAIITTYVSGLNCVNLHLTTGFQVVFERPSRQKRCLFFLVQLALLGRDA
jgi:hypothetical protein